MTYVSYIFVLDVSIFIIIDDEKEWKNQFFKYFLRILIKFEEKNLEIHKHIQLTLDNKSTQKIELYASPCWRHSISQTLSPVPSMQNFIF